LIVSNPPYVPSAEIETLEPEVRDFDPRVALDGGADGLDFFRQAAQEAGSRLKPAGRIMLEFGAGQAEVIRALFVAQNWIVERVVEDYSRQPRVLVARSM
jgi:release factor glutamine methyltransferase